MVSFSVSQDFKGTPFRVTTCLEMSGNLTAVREMSGILLKVREKLPETVYCKLYICVHTGIK